jgi:hypothetical protein
MTVSYPVRISAVLGTALLGTLLLRPAPRGPVRAGRSSPNRAFPTLRPPARSAYETALRTALRFKTQAELVVNEEREAAESSETAPDTGRSAEARRRTLTARDTHGDLARARAAARRAETLARTAEEAYRVALVRVRLECDAGRHEEELRQARKALALQPRNPNSLLALQHAAGCAGAWALQRWARERRAVLEASQSSH